MDHIKQNRWRLACFDLDGTLIVGTSTCQHLAMKLGHHEHLTRLEAQYASGEISNSAVAMGDGPYYAGYSLEQIRRHLENVPIINGIAKSVEMLADRGIDSLICTVTWRFAAEIMAERFGFLDASGTEMHIDERGVLTGRVSKHFDEFDKLAFVKSFCAARGIPLSQVFAVGDSRSDLPLFREVGFSIALNATPAAKAAASVEIDTDELTDVLTLVPDLLAH